jgi:hypothetical protein
MNVRNILIGVLVILAFFAGAYWQKTIAPAQQPAAEQAAPEAAPPGMPGGMPPSGATPEIAAGDASSVGIKWDVPSRWTDRGATSMRLATYDVPAKGGGDAGECAVFYFGPTQGGDPEANIDRWIGQFESHGKISRSTKKYGGLDVKLVEVEGAYLAPSGPMMESTGKKPGYMLKGAIVAGPNGNVFFKFTGPKKTLDSAAQEFEQMLGSMKKL